MMTNSKTMNRRRTRLRPVQCKQSSTVLERIDDFLARDSGSLNVEKVQRLRFLLWGRVPPLEIFTADAAAKKSPALVIQ
jgi:hypothetical protein